MVAAEMGYLVYSKVRWRMQNTSSKNYIKNNNCTYNKLKKVMEADLCPREDIRIEVGT